MSSRKATGSNSAELPVVIFILLVAVAFPLLDLAVLFMGVSAVFNAARVAATQSARAADYISSATQAKALVAGLSTSSVTMSEEEVQVSFVSVPMDGTAATPLTPPLEPEDIDRSKNIYQIQVSVTGHVAPLVMLSNKLFGDVPGVTAPLVITTRSTATFENSKGLSG